MSVYRIPVKDPQLLQHLQEVICEQFDTLLARAVDDHCTVGNPGCGEWHNIRDCCRGAVQMNGELVALAAAAMSLNGTVDNNLLHRILDNKCGNACIEDGCLVIDMWDDNRGEMSLQHNPPPLMPC